MHNKLSACGYIIDPNRIDEDDEILSIIKSLQQEQPVDLEKEIIDKWLKAGPITDTRYGDYCDDDIRETAYHFYELGLNARKEE